MNKQDWFTEAFGSTATDIRQQLVERAWFGEIVTPRPSDRAARDTDQPSIAEMMGWTRPDTDRGHHSPPPPQDHGIDF
ncbi:hypothetical protein PQ455_03390 [Sphingomonas naphthae]|uniref:Uncharacterized protein n=1 Tax=Sphingomonas naphthae TaxID=1813468 RepID=A0ABY7TM41_9SPHN|nr:hypothetical protein [Sphingomonas naphthae]WCT74285.1 hypothetical protein PQ455_03390 [Sphingomonas naphthae]